MNLTPLTQAEREAIASAAESVRARFGDAFPAIAGWCNVCGQDAQFVHWPDRHPRESFCCSCCYATGRYRALAQGTLQAIERITGVPARSIKEIAPPQGKVIRVLDAQIPFLYPPYSGYITPTLLAEVPGIEVTTTYFHPGEPWGTIRADGCRNENLEAMTFEDGTFDIVITSDVMEHVRLFANAHSEIRRVLRSPGAYLFTVPCTRGRFEHIIRVSTPDPQDPSKDEFLMEPEYHGSADPLEQDGVLSYRVFGTQLDVELTELGFSVAFERPFAPELRLIDSEYFNATC